MKSANLMLNRQKRLMKGKKLFFIWGMLALPIIHFLIFFVYINFSSIFMSFTNSSGEFTLFHYQEFFRQLTSYSESSGYAYRDAVCYSFALGINDVVLVLISTILAYFIFKKVPGRNVFRIIFFLPSIISITIYVTVYKLMLSSTSGLAGVILPDWGWLVDGTLAQKFAVPFYCLWVGTGYNILIIGGAMSNVPTEVIENAKLEGIGKFRELFQIIIPMIWPTLTVCFLGSITTVFTLFIQVQLITNGYAGTKTIAYIINSLTTSGDQLNYASAVGICFTVFSIPVVLLIKKLLEKIGKKWGY